MIKAIIKCALWGIKAVIGVLSFAILCYCFLLLLSPESKKLQEVKTISIDEGDRLGKWMLTRDKEIAHWLGQTYQGKKIQEPINIIMIDEVSVSSEEAIKFMYDSCINAKYLSRTGHSSDYLGEIAGRHYKQIPSEPNHAFSNELYILPNNHGRFFGPHQMNSKYYFVGALSREGINALAKIKHSFVSFKTAQEDFAVRMDERSSYKILGKYDMRNSIQNDKALSTGDHNGTGIVLTRSLR